MPLLAMMYPRGRKVDSETSVENVKIAARSAAELGVDIVKTNYTGSVESFREVTGGCPVPVVVAGGPRMETTEQILEMVHGSVEAGGSGGGHGPERLPGRGPRQDGAGHLHDRPPEGIGGRGDEGAGLAITSPSISISEPRSTDIPW